jgi:hypothetical protein
LAATLEGLRPRFSPAARLAGRAATCFWTDAPASQIGRSGPGPQIAALSIRRNALPYTHSLPRSHLPREDTHVWKLPRRVSLGTVSRPQATRRILYYQCKVRTVMFVLFWSSYFNRVEAVSVLVPSVRSRVPRTSGPLLREWYHLPGAPSRCLAVFASAPSRRPSAVACGRGCQDPRQCARSR